MIRSFLSVNITDDEILQAIRNIQDSLDRNSAKMKLIKPENIHFTLRFLGDTKISKLEELRNELEKINFESFNITIEGVGAFPKISRPRIIWTGVTENSAKFVELKKQLDKGFAKMGYSKDRRFTPHATIARVRSIKEREVLKRNISSLVDTKVGQMEIKEVIMMSSTLTPHGPIYKPIWKIKLT